MIRCTGVVRSFEQVGLKIDVLKGVDIHIQTGNLTVLRGRSGSGKTTLLNILGGLDLPSKGTVEFDGQMIHQLNDRARTGLRKSKFGFVFQSYALLPHLSAYENVELSLRLAGLPSREWKSRVGYCLELVGLSKRSKHRPYELSGGEQQRVAIAKAFAHKPKIILADEPTAELDSQMAKQILRVFHDVMEHEQITICMTTHDPKMMEGADQIYEMVDGIITNIS